MGRVSEVAIGDVYSAWQSEDLSGARVFAVDKADRNFKLRFPHHR
jgi:hypothetical protein